MARKIKCELKMKSGVEIRDLDQLRRDFDPEQALMYFRSGKLVEWLRDRYYDDEADAIAAIDKDDPNAANKFCTALGINYEDYYDVEFLARIKAKKAILSKQTTNPEIINNAKITALDQQDLADLLDLDEPLIYLCGAKFTVPLRAENKKYVGVLGKPKINISVKSQSELNAKHIVFENCELPWGTPSSTAKSKSTARVNRSTDDNLAILAAINKRYNSPSTPSRLRVGSPRPSNNFSNYGGSGTYEATATIMNRTGMHARPASLFVQTACSFRSKIQLNARGKTVDAKSILMIMSMGLVRGTEVKIVADGPDAKQAVDALIALIDSKFGEE